MQSSLLADDDLPDTVSLVASVTGRATPGHYDEWCASVAGTAAASATGHAPAPHWRQFFQTLGTQGWADLPARAHRVQARVREDGATYNVYAEGVDAPRAWPLELLPFIVPADEWALIEAGVTQRARLMAATLADIYGPQTLLRDALLPASLVFAHPHYLRPACGLWPAQRCGLHIAAFDLARTPGGGFRVLAQRLQAPSGLGYLLENRLIIGPQFHDQFADLRVQRLAATFRSLLDGLVRASPAGERSRIVLLTPGPLNETYFEQVFLARYLGVTLVEGSDLTVRGKKLYLKTLHGLEQVHVLLRRVDDEFLDPLELRPDSQLGVPGLLQALRAGEVVMANAPGSGVLESPGLAAFWPGVADRLLGEDLLLPASTSWWCGEATVWRGQRDALANFVVAPTFPDSGFGPRVAALMSEAERRALRDRIDADPAAYTLQARVRPSETPVWGPGTSDPGDPGGQLHPRAAVMRVFALADGQGGWQVLPGALTRVANRSSQHPGSAHDPWLSMQHGSASVDTWVIASGAVDKSSLLPKPLTADDLGGMHRAVSSRAAENLFWLGRYTERAENSVRLVRLMLEMLREGSDPVLRMLDRLARFHGLVGAGVPGVMKAPRVFERALIHGLVPREPGAPVDTTIGGPTTSVAHNLRSLRQCAQNLRERLSPEHWKLIHEVSDHFEQHLRVVLSLGEGHAPVPDVLGVLARATTHLAAITGAQTDRMTRDDGWRLLSVGRQIERLGMLSHALGLGFELKVHEADDGFALLLGLFDSVITYRAQFQGRREVLPLLHLLAMDTDNPRSLAWVARTMRDRLRKLARHDPIWVQQVTRDLPMPEDWLLARLSRTDERGRHTELIDGLHGCSTAARGLSDQISRHLFAHVESRDRTVWQ
ncbi:MAG: circularly permuted type 2 ATP-grasp protein [Aquabacterium sp.]|nr:circularly permuted type 2 ATP-grasp protein [Aquabacterium sp.]